SGMVAQRLGDHDRAVACFRRSLSAWPDDPDLHVDLGRALRARGDAEGGVAAIEALQKARDLDPQNAGIGVSLARILAVAGRVDDATREFRKVLQHEPGNADAWLGLSNLNTVRFDAADTEHLRAAWKDDKRTDTERERLGFSYAKALEDCGDYAAA